MYLIADIGGTNSRLTLIKDLNKKFLKLKVYPSKNFKNIYELIKNYFSEINSAKKQNIKIAVISVAGPVIKNKAHLTNLEWDVDGSKIKKYFDFEKVILVNDLYGLAASVLLLKKKDLFKIKPEKRTISEPKAFIAPGTGLGEAILVKRNPLIILPTEGGHLSFSPLNSEEWEYLQFLKEKEEELSWEKALSGTAISYWYEFYYKKTLHPKEITKLAKKGDEKAQKVILKFFELLGRKVSQIAFMSIPFGGIYLSGGVLIALKEFFEKQEYKNQFFKGYYINKKMEKILKIFPIYLILYPYPVLLGGLSILRSQL